MKKYLIKINEGNYIYDKYKINEQEILKLHKLSKSTKRIKLKTRLIFVDGISLHYLIQELRYAPAYRRCFVNIAFVNCNLLKFMLVPVQNEILDYLWNEKITYLVREKCELDHTLSWLSTLGGAFSALGDYSIDCAKMAGKISFHQLQLAFKLSDDGIVSRCKLYFSLSLIQRKYYKLAKKIIYNEYVRTSKAPVIDQRLISMCKGIWSKLQYERNLNRQCNKLKELNIIS